MSKLQKRPRAGCDGYNLGSDSKVHAAGDPQGHLLAAHIAPGDEQASQARFLYEQSAASHEALGGTCVSKLGLYGSAGTQGTSRQRD